ncbi:protein MKS1-like [Salvia splendens]|uniref:protein MKS1-like n=1 Tax=Salvia splendens TaxID=180675 RepID=UPI001C25B6F3|nr:protein MKS1-like [Salvia splendens]
MDTPNFFSGRSPSPRRELQGPRPAPLKVRKDSHKIRKPHAPPLPVIIYTVSPKIIHANPNDFMSLVQRLTGPNATSPSCTPAARFASIERTKSPDVRKTADEIEIDSIIRKNVQFPGILSPNPSALPQIHPNLFNISSDNNSSNNYFHELSPVLYSSRNYLENNLISPNTLDLFHSLFDVQSQEELQRR